MLRHSEGMEPVESSSGEEEEQYEGHDVKVTELQTSQGGGGKKMWEMGAAVGEPLKTQLFLRDDRNGGLTALTELYGVRARRHNTWRNLVLLKYSQITAPFYRAITRECRGLVLDEDDDWNVVCYPYSKFFNADEPYAAMMRPHFDWTSARVYEKLDGSLATLYHYKGDWHVASSGTPDGDGELGATQGSFANLFWRVWEKRGLKLPTDPSRCYIFEMLSREHPIVVIPSEDSIILHGVRDLKTLKEVAPEDVAHEHGWPCVQAFPLRTLEQLEVAVRKLNPHQQEGFVVVDVNWNRLKIKSPQYVALSFLDARGDHSLNEQKMLKIVRENETDEFLAYYKHWTTLCAYVRKRYERTVAALASRLVMQRVKKGGKIKGGNSDSRRQQGAADTEEVLSLVKELSDKGCASERDVREYLSKLGITRCEAIVGLLSPVDQVERNEMLLQQQIDMDAAGINTKKKKKKKKNHKGKFGKGPTNDIEREAPPPRPRSPSPPSTKKGGKKASPPEWEVVTKGKRRANKKGDDDIDKLVAEVNSMELERKKKGGGKKGGRRK